MARYEFREISLGDYERLIRLKGEARYLLRMLDKAPFNRHAKEARRRLGNVRAELRTIQARSADWR